MPMGTIKQEAPPVNGGSTLGSDFDANNRTLDVGTGSHQSTIRRDIIQSSVGGMQGVHRTEYDKPWFSKQERQRENAREE